MFESFMTISYHIINSLVCFHRLNVSPIKLEITPTVFEIGAVLGKKRGEMDQAYKKYTLISRKDAL